MEIRVHKNNVEKALKLLKRKLLKAGFYNEIKRRSYYEKPSQKKRRKAKEAVDARSKARKMR